MSLSLQAVMETCQSRLEKMFHLYLRKTPTASAELQKAIEYGVMNGGKRLRPLLVYLVGHTFAASFENMDAAATTIEMIHSYSLIHDDLPAMDNADLRRGKASCHKAFNEALAILAGDSLQPLAFEILAVHPSTLSAEQRLAMIQVLANASGMEGMAAGQALDMGTAKTLDDLIKMYRLKTGALLIAAVQLGMLAANQIEHLASLEKFAAAVGLAFQLQDDLLDIEKTAQQIGKTVGVDAANCKKTYVSFVGVEKTREKISLLFAEARQALECLGEKKKLLDEFLEMVFQRDS